MFVWTVRRKRIRGVIIILIVITLISLVLTNIFSCSKAEEREPILLPTVESRKEWISQNGWITSGEEKQQIVHIPAKFDDVYNSYAEMQKESGFDLVQWRGAEVRLCQYDLEDQLSTITLIIDPEQGTLIGGDVSENVLGGTSQPLIINNQEVKEK